MRIPCITVIVSSMCMYWGGQHSDCAKASFLKQVRLTSDSPALWDTKELFSYTSQKVQASHV